ncbi:hypothetical protein [Ardenticatena maritima]|nr:hypothetical protein [Ardenticatena maritima]
MVIHMAGCLRCTNYKANLGCTVCSQRAVRNTKAPMSTIMRWFKRAQNEVREFLATFTEENKAVAGGDDRRAA